MTKAIIDASAMIAFLREEDGYDVVGQWIHLAMMSAVNLAEVLQKLTDNAKEESMLHAVIHNLSIDIVDFDESLAIGVARLFPNANKGISLANRACLALGVREGLPVITGDRDWATLDVDAEIIEFRSKVN